MRARAKQIRIVRIFYRWHLAQRYLGTQRRLARKWVWQDTEDSNFMYRVADLNLRQLAHFVAQATGVDLELILVWLGEIEKDKRLREHLEQARSRGIIRKHSDLSLGRRVGWYAMIRATKPSLVVETGVDLGLGACVICTALLENAKEGKPGRYLGTDINPEAGALLSGEFATVGSIRFGDSLQTLLELNETIDLFVNDSDHSEEYEAREYEVIVGKLSEEALVISDNSHVTSALMMWSEEVGRQFHFFSEVPKDHWYPGAGIGVSTPRTQRQ